MPRRCQVGMPKEAARGLSVSIGIRSLLEGEKQGVEAWKRIVWADAPDCGQPERRLCHLDDYQRTFSGSTAPPTGPLWHQLHQLKA